MIDPRGNPAADLLVRTGELYRTGDGQVAFRIDCPSCGACSAGASLCQSSRVREVVMDGVLPGALPAVLPGTPASLYWSRTACTRVVAVICGLPLAGMGAGALCAGSGAGEGMAALAAAAGLAAGLASGWLIGRLPAVAISRDEVRMSAAGVPHGTFLPGLPVPEFPAASLPRDEVINHPGHRS